MLNNKLICAIFVSAHMSVASAAGITISEMVKMNSEIIQLEAEIALAKKREDLAKLKPVVVAPTTAAAPPAIPKQRNPREQIEGIALRETYGDITNLIARFEINGTQIARRKNEYVYSWRVLSVKNDHVILIHESAKPADTISQTVFQSGPQPQSLPVGRDALRVPSAAPIVPITVVPATKP